MTKNRLRILENTMANKIIKSDVDKSHQYAVGVCIEGGGFAPIQTYETEKQLEEGFSQWYQNACQRGITKPIAVKKEAREQGWDGAQCFILRGLMEKIT